MTVRGILKRFFFQARKIGEYIRRHHHQETEFRHVLSRVYYVRLIRKGHGNGLPVTRNCR